MNPNRKMHVRAFIHLTAVISMLITSLTPSTLLAYAPQPTSYLSDNYLSTTANSPAAAPAVASELRTAPYLSGMPAPSNAALENSALENTALENSASANTLREKAAASGASTVVTERAESAPAAANWLQPFNLDALTPPTERIVKAAESSAELLPDWFRASDALNAPTERLALSSAAADNAFFQQATPAQCTLPPNLAILITPPPGIISLGNTAGDVYTVTLTNNGTLSTTNLSLLIDPNVGFYYVGNSAAINSADGAAVSGPTANSTPDTPVALTLTGASNAATALEPGENLVFTFRLATTDRARSGQPLSITVQSGQPPTTCKTRIENLPTGRGNLTVFKSPQSQTGSLGDTITWTMRVLNNGLGNVYDATVTDVPDVGLANVVVSPPPQPLTLAPDEFQEYVVTAQIASCRDLTNAAQGVWSIGNADGTATTAKPVQEIVDIVYDLVDGQIAVEIGAIPDVPYCGALDATVPVTVSNAGGTIRNLRLLPNVIGAEATTNDPNWAISGNEWRYTGGAPLPAGTLVSGESIVFNLRLTSENLCAARNVSVALEPIYTDACELVQASSAAGTTGTELPVDAPTLSVSKSGSSALDPDVLVVGMPFIYTIDIAGENLDNSNLTRIDIQDLVPSGVDILNVTATDGTLNQTGNEVNLALTNFAPGPFAEQLQIESIVPRSASQLCSSNAAPLLNQVTAIAAACPECTLAVTDTLTSYLVDFLDPTLNTFHKTAAPIELCSPDLNQTITADMQIGSGITWTNSIYTDTLGAPTAPFNVVNGSVVVTIDGIDVTNDVAITTGPPLIIDFSNISGTAPFTAFAQNADIQVTYAVTAGVNTLGAGDPASARPFLYSEFSINGPLQSCTDSGAAFFGTPVDFQRGELDVQVNTDSINSCQENDITLTVSGGADQTITDNIIVTFQADPSDIITPTAFTLGGSFVALDPNDVVVDFEPVSNLVTFTLPAGFDANGEGTIVFPLFRPCGVEGVFTTQVSYQDRCDVPRRAEQRFTPQTLASNIILFTTPNKVTVNERSATYRFYIKNGGSQAADTLVITNTLADFHTYADTSNNSSSNPGLIPGIDVTLGTAPDGRGIVTWTVPPGLVPGGQIQFDVTTEFPQCFAPSTTEIAVTQQCGQVGSVCQGRQSGIIEFVPGPTGLLTSNNQTANLPLCEVGEVLLITKNTSPRSQEFNLTITDTINNGTFMPDPAPRVTVFDASGAVVVGTTSGVPLQNIPFSPTGIITDGIDSELVWSLSGVSAGTAYYDVLAVRNPSDRIEIVFNVQTSCSGPSIDVQSAGHTFDVCNIPLSFLEESKSLVVDEPEIQVTKQGRNVTTGGAFGSDIFGSVNDEIEWRIDVENVGPQRATNLFVNDSVPANFEITSIQPVDGFGTFTPSDAEWGDQGGTGGLTLEANESKSFIITGNVIDGVACTPEAINTASVNFGCSAGQTCLDVPVEAQAILRTQPTFQAPVSAGNLTTCGGLMTIQLFTEGPPATDVIVTDSLPAGFVYAELVDITVSPQVGVADLTGQPASGDTELIWTFDSIPGSNPGTAPTKTTITFRVRNAEPSSANACMPLAPTVQNTVHIEYNDTCTASGPYTASAQSDLRVLRPSVTIDKTPDKQIADAGETVTWQLTVNANTQTASPGVVITDVVGSGFTNVTASEGTVNNGDSNSPTIREINGQTVITWTPSIEIPRRGNWQATVTAQVVENAVHTNTLSVRGNCDTGCFYATTSDTAYVTLLEEFAKAPDLQSATIGEAVVFTVTATLPDEDALYANVVLTDSLPPGLGFVDARIRYTTDGDANAGGPTTVSNRAPDVAPAQAQSGDVVWLLGDLDGTLQFTAIITAVVQNVIGNQHNQRLTNESFLSYQDDGQAYAVDDRADVDIVEPTLRVEKSVDPISAKPGQTVFYEILLYHDGASTVPAYNVRLADLLPAGMRYNPGSWQLFGEPQATAVLTDAFSPQLSAFFPVLNPNRTVINPLRLRYSATIDQNISQGALFTNTATIDYTSLPDDPYGETRDGSGGVNDYAASNDAMVSIDGISLKKSGPITVTAGELITYNLSVLNIGPFMATNAVVTDTMPFQMVSGTISAFYNVPGGSSGPCTITPNAQGDLVVCALDEIAVGVTARMTITGQVNPNTPLAADLTNRAQLRVTSQDNDLLDNFAEVDTEVFTESDIGVTKRGPVTAIAGETISYTIVLSNTGPSTARDVDLKDILPPGLTYAGASTTQGQCVSAICQLGDVAVGSTITMVVSATVGADVTGPLTNRAQYFGDTADANPANDSDTASTTVNGLSALQISKTDLTDPVFAGNTYLYEIVITNTGPSAAENVVIRDALPQQVTIEGSSPNGCVHDGTSPGGNVTCALGTMQPGEVRDFLINVRVNTDIVDGEIGTNVVTATTTTPIDQANSILTDSEPTTYRQASGAATDLQLTKSVAPATVAAGGGLVTYTLIVANNGPAQASAVQVVDAFPRQFDFVSAATSRDTTDSLCSNGVTCDLGVMAINDVVTITLAFQVPADVAAGTYTNTAHVSSPAAETISTNNTDAAAVQVTADAALQIRKVAHPNPAIPGEDLTYTLIVTNTGLATAQNVVVSDALPADFTANLILSSQGGCAALPCLLGQIASGGNASITINGTVAPDAGPNLQNSATASADNATDATTTIQTPVDGFADVALELTSTPTVVSGGAITVTATVFNTGPSVAPNAVVTITLPPATTFNAADTTLPPGWTAIDNGDGTVTLSAAAPLQPGAQIDLPIIVTPDPTIPAGTSIEFTAQVTADARDANLANNRATADTSVGGGIADLLISKTQLAPTGAVTAGELVTYTITISNAGPNGARGVDVKDQLPPGMTLVTIDASHGGICGGPICQYGSLPVGATRTVTVTARVASSTAAGNLVNTAGVFSTDDPDAPADNSASVTTAIETAADLHVTKTDLFDPVAPGGAQLYQIVVTNDGPSDAQNVIITDTLDANVSLANATPNCGEGAVGQVICSLSTLAAGAAHTFFISVNVSQQAADGATLRNAVAVGSHTPDPNALNNTDLITTAVQGFGNLADLGIVKTTDTAALNAGERITYTLTVTNSGPSVATNARLLELVPAGTTVVRMNASNPDDSTADCSLGGACYLGTIFTDTVAIVTVVLQVHADFAGLALTNSASISADQQETDASDNFSTVTTPVGTNADLGIRKVDLLDPVTVGEVLPYQIVITNAGPSDAHNVVITDTLDVNVHYAGSSPGCVHDGAAFGGAVTCTIGTIAAGGQAFVLIDARVDASLSTTTTIINHVALGSSTPDTNPDNNEANAETQARPGTLSPTDLSISKSGPATATAGELLTYTLTVTNNGNGLASNVQVVDALPLGLSLESIASSQGLCNAGITCDLGDLVVNATATITIVARVNADQIAPVLNQARVSAANPDNNPTNNQAAVGTQIETSADLGILKTATPVTATPGSLLTYQIVITNAGPSDAQNVVVEDLLPAELRGAFFSASQGSCSGGTCTLGAIPAGGRAIISIVGTVAANATTAFTNVATVSSSTADPNAANNASQVTTPVAASADLQLALTSTPTVSGGGAVTVTAGIFNAGPSDAIGTLITVTLPAGTTYDAAATNAALPAGWSAVDNGDGTVTLATAAPLPTQTQVDLPVVATVETTVAPGTSLEFSGITSADTADPNLFNNTANADSSVISGADLALELQSTPTVGAGASMWLTATLFNNGPLPANGAVVTVTLPPSTTFNAGATVLPPGWTAIDNGNGTVTLSTSGVLTPDASIDLPLVVDVDPAAPTGASIQFNGVVGSDSFDPTLSNNRANADTTLISGADLNIEMSATPTVVAGEQVTATVHLANSGSQPAAGAIITVTLPPGTTFDAAATNAALPAGWSAIDNGDGTITLVAAADLPAGANLNLPVVALVDPSVESGTSLEFTATAHSDTPDTNPLNNNANADSSVLARAVLQISKTGTPNPVVAGELLTYTIVVTNSGPSTATDVRVLDAIPPQTRLVSARASNGGVCDAGVICLLGSLGVSQTATVIIVVDVAQTLQMGTLITNTATVFSEQLDPPVPIPATETTVVTGLVDLSIEKQDLPDPVGAGETLRYQLLLANAGPSDAFNVVITDTLDVRTSFLQTTPGFNCGTLAGNRVVCAIPVLRASASVLIELDVTVAANLADGTVITNSVVITSDTPELNLVNNRDVEPTTITAGADLRVRKVGPATVRAGGFITYTIVVDNLGPSPALNVVITDAIPVGMVVASVVVSPTAGCVVGGEIVCMLGTLGVTDTMTLRVSGQVDPGVAADSLLINTVRGTTSSLDPNPLNNVARVETVVGSGADLALRKDGPTTVVAGAPVTYTIVMTNNGPSTAHFVDVKETLPPGVTLDRASIVRSLSSDPAACGGPICQAGDVLPGEVITITVVGDVDPTLADGTVITNTATAFAQTPDPDQSNNVDTATSRVEARAQLVVSKRDLLDPVTQGALLLYSIVVTNGGPSAAAGVIVTDVLPPEVTYQGNAAECVESPLRTLTCALGTLTAGESRSLLVAVRVEPWVVGGTTFENRVNITSTTPLNESVLSDVEPTTVEQFNGPPADLGIEKQVRPAGAKTGEMVTYTLIISNNGPATATDVTVVDALPDGLALRSVTSSQGFCNQGITCLLGTMPFSGVPSTATVTILAQVLPSVIDGAILTNTAAVHANQPDPNPANDLDEVGVEIGAEADLVLRKISSQGQAAPGETIEYVIEVTNNGPANAVNAVIRDTLPASLRHPVSGTVNLTVVDHAQDCALSAATLTCALGTLTVGERVRIAYRVMIPQGASGTMVNSATAESDTPDPNDRDNAGQAETRLVPEADLSIQKNVSAGEILAGQLLTYTLTVRNNGPSTAQNVRVTDELPLGANFITATPMPEGTPEIANPHTWSLGVMQPGEERVIVLKVRVDIALDNTTLLHNMAQVNSDTPDSNPANNQGETLTQVFDAPVADLAVTKFANQAIVVPGGPITYTLIVTNYGPDVATDVVVKDLLAEGVRYRSGRDVRSGQSCVLDLLNVPVCYLGTLAVGESVRIQFVTVLEGGTAEQVENVAVVESDSTYDFNSDNNSDSDITPVVKKPSAIGLLRFTTQSIGAAIQVNWATAYEEETVGFRVLRSTGTDSATARPISEQLIPIQGAQYGGFYALMDPNVVPYETYYYWLEEVRLDGSTVLHGPAMARMGDRIYLPLVQK